MPLDAIIPLFLIREDAIIDIIQSKIIKRKATDKKYVIK
jgi:hypothetical protein